MLVDLLFESLEPVFSFAHLLNLLVLSPHDFTVGNEWLSILCYDHFSQSPTDQIDFVPYFILT